MNRNKKIILSLILLLVVGSIVYLSLRTNILPPYNNRDAGCFNCLGQVGLSMRMYSQEFDEYFPAGKETPLDSLALLEKEGFLEAMHCYTSHALGQELSKYYKKHKRIPKELCCYRYNEGLTESAPVDSVVMYYDKPIKWACYYNPTSEKGRLILFLDGHRKFHPEAEFQKFQKKTLDWIKENTEIHNEEDLLNPSSSGK
jgi:hypothetical protein